MTNSTDYDNRPLDEVERLRAAQVEALNRRIEELEARLEVLREDLIIVMHELPPESQQNVALQLVNRWIDRPEAKERP